ncbi:peptidoglycan endopeptidase [Xanthomonas sp. LMG 8992]|uniref:peptidoglycan endopeptidase n=1 Tax=Xanthomonas sp. LMG 8992 TaxID=1591157 RepID=UPI00136EC66C|nr:peptidoglycan endopeptidase [Xanthomonas sp. LMG 8992]MXV11640.1 peptidoglycan endopeptidase [Xanthomonas sp. LMG 8992]
MRASQLEPYIGIPYDEAAMDCADLVMLVQRELFGRTVQVPSVRPRGAAGQVTIGALSRQYAERTETPADGDLVLMHDRGQERATHAGVYVYLAHEPWVLHTNSALGHSALHRARELPDYGARIEGYYRWI